MTHGSRKNWRRHISCLDEARPEIDLAGASAYIINNNTQL